MIINHNIAALNTLNQLSKNEAATQKSLQKLSSGLRINSAADDAAGLAISEKMKGQINGLDQATSNAQDASSLVQTAEGSLSETTDILQRMRELAVQAGNDTNTTADRSQIQQEMDQLTSEVNRIGNTTQFNTQNLLKGQTPTGAVTATSVTPGAGTYTLTIGTAFTSGDSVTIDGKTFSFGSTGDIASGTSGAEAASLKAAISGDATLGAKYTVSVATNVITLTQKAGYYSATAPTESSSGTGAAAVATTTSGVAANTTAFTISKNLQAGDNITINGTTYTAVSGTAGNDEFQVGANSGATATALAAAVNTAETAKGGSTQVTATVSGSTVKLASADTNFYASYGNVSEDTTLTFQIGANTGQSFSASFKDMRSQALGISTGDNSQKKTVNVEGADYQVAWKTVKSVTDGTDSATTEYSLDVSDHDKATAAVQVIDDAVNAVSTERAKYGAYENRLDHTVNNLTTSSQNLTDAQSRISDVDMAQEMSNFTKNNILNQAAQAMLAQANQLPQGVLQLLR